MANPSVDPWAQSHLGFPKRDLNDYSNAFLLDSIGQLVWLLRDLYGPIRQIKGFLKQSRLCLWSNDEEISRFCRVFSK